MFVLQAPLRSVTRPTVFSRAFFYMATGVL